MNKQEMVEYLTRQGLKPVFKPDVTELMISGKVIRCEASDCLIAAVGNDATKDEQLHGIVDSVHWHLQTRGTKGKIKLVYGSRHKKKENLELIDSASLMIKSLKVSIEVALEFDFKSQQLTSPSFSHLKPGWLEYFKARETFELPDLAKDLQALVNDESFQWYRNVTGQYWSGRVEGLQVCTISPNGKRGQLDVGKPGKKGDGHPRKIFLQLSAGSEGSFDHSKTTEVARVIQDLTDSRRNGALNKYEREHLLESRVLRGAVKISNKDKILQPMCSDFPFQFPALWSPNADKPRYVDALMFEGKTPWVLELKEPNGSSIGQGYRHAITQAVLYREYIKRADQFHPWFKSYHVDPEKCLGAVAFPRMDNTKRNIKIFKQHQAAGEAFGIEVISIDGFE